MTEDLKSPCRKLRPPKLGDVRWSSGFWADRFDLCHKTVIPGMHRALGEPDNGAVSSNFTVAAGLERGKHLGRNWSDGDCYKWLEAIAHVYAVTADGELDRLMDETIDVIAKAQEPDGYLCTQVQLTDKRRWAERGYHELYNMGHLMTAACVHHRATGKDTFLRVAIRAADHLYAVFKPRPPELAHFGFNPSNIMGLVDLYRVTGDTRYLELAGVFIDMRGSAPGGDDQNQTRTPLREETEAVGHAVTAAYLYCGAADVLAETGEGALRKALERIWRNMTARKMYVTGGIGALHRGVSSHGDPVHEAFAPDCQLPNRTAYNETCANVANAMWNWRMLNLTAEAGYADVMERVLYNSMLSGVDVGGKRFFYTNPLARHARDVPLLSHDTPARWFTHKCYCCPPQVARTVAQVHEWAYSCSEEGVWVHLYGGSELASALADGTPVGLAQETAYPWDGNVKITIRRAPDAPLALMLRIPGWAEEAEIRVNGGRAGPQAAPGTYAAVERRWSAGDEIELAIPMDVRLLEADPMVEETRGQVCVMRGPVVYCLESVDLPENVSIDQVRIPPDIRFTPRHDDNLLGGVTVLEGEARRVPEPSRKDALYGELRRPVDQTETVPITLIPYYAWCNRGECEMRVWTPTG